MKRKITIFALLLCQAISMTSCKDGNEILDPTIYPSVSVEVVSNYDYSNVEVLIRPADGAVRTIYYIGSESDIASFEAGTLSGIETKIGSDEFTQIFAMPGDNAKYTVFARSYNALGLASPIVTTSVSPAFGNLGTTINFIAEKSFSADISISYEYYKYTCAIGKTSDKAAFEAGTLAGTITRTEPGLKFTEGFSNLVASTDYVLFIQGYYRNGTKTKVISVPFTTKPVGECPGMTAQIEPTSTLYKTDFTFVPNDKCGKLVVVTCLKGEWDSYLYTAEGYSGNVMEMLPLWAEYQMDGFISKVGGTLTTDIVHATMEKELQLEAYIVIYDLYLNPVSFERIDFKSGSPVTDAPAAQAGTVSVTNITSKGATFTLSPGANTFAYVHEIYVADYYDRIVAGQVSGITYTEDYFSNFMWTNRSSNIQFGNVTNTFTENYAQPNTRYYILMSPMNVNGPLYGGWGPMTKVEFTTLPSL